MHDLNALRADPERFQRGLRRKGDSTDVSAILECDRHHRKLLEQIEPLRHRRNDLSRRIAELGAQTREAASLRDEAARIGEQIRDWDRERADVQQQLNRLLIAVPNLPDPSVPDGTGGHVVRVGREPATFSFPLKPHWEVAEQLGLVDFRQGTKLVGPSFPVLWDQGARLERALVQFMLDLHARDHQAREVSIPFLVNRSAMFGTGQLPRLEGEMYRVERDDLFLIPTAEVPITNLFRDAILDGDDLPIRLVGTSACFRREAGAAGRETRGMVRVHQFQKVELVHFVEPEQGHDALEELTRQAEEVLRRLELPYRVVEVCAADLSFASAKTYDLEVYAPGSQRWLEVSSCSWFGDFQARRCNIRYRTARGKLRYVHTLNASGLAIPRTFIGIIENQQDPDGSVRVPDVLGPYMDGLKRIGPAPAPEGL